VTLSVLAVGSRRTFYAFLLTPLSFSLERQLASLTQREKRGGGGEEEEKEEEATDRFVALRTFKEWEAVLPVKKIKGKPANYKRLNEIQQRRLKLVSSFFLA
jgi:hypothetical protein